MAVKDDLGKRMKEFYEQIPKTRLMRRTPVAIRIDARAFHTFTKGMKKPFDEVVMKSMQGTMKYLCENISGCVFGYTQSDEITLVLVDYQTLTTSAWFDYEVQKLCSITASMATLAFNKIFSEYIDSIDPCINFYNVVEGYDSEEEIKEVEELWQYANSLGFYTLDDIEKYTAYYRKVENTAMFDARCFNIPKEEVTNLVYWRQLDAARNSVQMVGHANFTQKELHGKSCNMIQDMLHEQKGINWNDYATPYKRGTACIRKEGEGWVLDYNMPQLKGDDREYLDKLVYVGGID